MLVDVIDIISKYIYIHVYTIHMSIESTNKSRFQKV